MPSFNDVKKITSLGQVDWKNRLKVGIYLISPSGIEFNLKYRSDEQTKGKKLQIVLYPDVIGNTVRDLGTNSEFDNIELYFDGPNHDLESQKFWDAVDESGQWGMQHPIDGFKSVQLIQATKRNNPVDSGGITIIDTQWIEPLNIEQEDNGKQLASLADTLGKQLNDNSALSFIEKLVATTKALRQGIKNNTDKVLGLVDKILSPIATANVEIFSTMLTIQNSINDIFNATVLQSQMLAGQLQQIIEFPLLSINDSTSKTIAYINFANENMAFSVNTDKIEPRINITFDDIGRNKLAITELVAIASVNSMCQILTTSNIRTKFEGFDLVNQSIKLFNDTKEKLEYIQVHFRNESIEKRYISNEQIENNMLNLLNISTRYVLSQVADVKTEKRIILDRYRTPYEIVFTEYKSNNEENIDKFIEINNLNGLEIIILPPGREVIL